MKRLFIFFDIVLYLFFTTTVHAETFDGFIAWITDPQNKTEVRFLQKATIIANTRDQLITAYNAVIARGGSYNKYMIERFEGCTVLQGWSYARIIETKTDSNVVKVMFKHPFRDLILEKYVHINQSPRLVDIQKRVAQ